MENNLKWIVYCTINTQNKKIYTGVHQTVNPDVFDGYLGCDVYVNRPATYEKAKYVFQHAVKKYGPKCFIRKTIAVFNNEEEAYLMEAEIVNAEYLKRSDVYNTALGGHGGDRGLTAIKIYQYDVKGKFIAEYDSISHASRVVGRSHRTIWRAAKDKIKSADSFWSYDKYGVLDLTHYKTDTNDRGIPVYQYSETGEYECCYDSSRDCARVNGWSSNATLLTAIKLGNMCKGKYYTTVFSPTYSIAKSTRVNNEEVHQYSLQGVYIQSWKNQRTANKSLGFTTSISTAIRLGRSAGGYLWSWEKLGHIAPVAPKSGKARKVGKYDKEWNLIKEYNTLTACKKENGAGLAHVLDGRDEFAKGFRYKYIEN